MNAAKETRTTAAPILSTVPVAAARLGLSRSFFYEQVKRGRIRLVKCGGRSLVHENELVRFADALAAEAAQPKAAA